MRWVSAEKISALMGWFQYDGHWLFVSLQFCDVATHSSHPQQELAKFGYRSERKVEFFIRILLNILEPVCLNMAISDLFSLKSGDFGAFFCTKILYMGCTGLFVGAKIHPKRKKRTLMMDWIIPGFFVSGPLFSQRVCGLVVSICHSCMSFWLGGLILWLIGWISMHTARWTATKGSRSLTASTIHEDSLGTTDMLFLLANNNSSCNHWNACINLL